ncbi:MAG: cyclic nucleotide-binding domain-containing protein [Planctomycetota bacterium]
MVALNRLKSVPVFDELDQEQARLLAPLMQERHYGAGDEIFREGEPARALVVLLDGLVSLRTQPEHGDEPVTLASLRGRQILGWSAVVGGDTYRASAICLEESVAIELEGGALLALCRKHPDLGVRVLHQLSGVIADRLDATRRQLERRLRPGLISHG